MTTPFLNKAEGQMGAIERLLKGLPIVGGYVNKEMRREADFRLRQTIASGLEAEKQRLYRTQMDLIDKGGLLYTDDVDGAVQKLQILADRIRTASYGYGGLLDAVKVQEEQLEALHRFDVALAERTYEIHEAISELQRAVDEGDEPRQPVRDLKSKLDEFNTLFSERHHAVLNPGLLTGANAPEVPDDWMAAADSYAAGSRSSSSDRDPFSERSGGDNGDAFDDDGFDNRDFDRKNDR